MKKITWEITDTFCGEANYAWVKRGELELPENASELAIVRAVKKAIGWNGVQCRKESLGEIVALYPSGSCAVCFID